MKNRDIDDHTELASPFYFENSSEQPDFMGNPTVGPAETRISPATDISRPRQGGLEDADNKQEEVLDDEEEMLNEKALRGCIFFLRSNPELTFPILMTITTAHREQARFQEVKSELVHYIRLSTDLCGPDDDKTCEGLFLLFFIHADLGTKKDIEVIPPQPSVQSDMYTAMRILGRHLARMGNLTSAEIYFQRALAGFRKLGDSKNWLTVNMS